MKTIYYLIVLLTSLICSQILTAQPNQKFRVFVLTDIENEPDDAQSLVRFMTYSNH